SPATAAQVAERALDLGVVSVAGSPDPRVTFEPLGPHEDVVICPPRHPLANRTARLDQLLAHPLLLLDRTTGARAALDAVFAQARLRPRVTMEMSSVEVLKRLVELGFGV